METVYILRIHTDELDRETVTQFLKDNTSLYIYVDEVGKEGRGHIHCLIHSDVNNRTLRSRLRAIGATGNKAYSLTKVTEGGQYPVKYLAYMLKSGAPIQGQVDMVPEESWAKAEEYDKVKKKEAELKVWERVYQAIIEQSDDDKRPSDFEIQKAIIDYHYEHRIAVRKFQVQSYFETILLKLHKERIKDSLSYDEYIRNLFD